MNETNAKKTVQITTTLNKEGMVFYNIDSAPFEIYGIYRDGEKYRRMPADVAETVNPGVLANHAHTAGGRVRFITDSPYVAIHAEMGKLYKADHFPFTGSIGFDLYVDNRYERTFRPDYNIIDTLDRINTYDGSGMHEITIHFPLYSEVKALYIGLDENATVCEAKPYRNEKPIVYYGSSITQGGCASTPGMAYQNIVTRRLMLDHVNLGFSGNAKGEDTMIEYLAGLDMAMFVQDYDHNAPTVEHLRATHEKLYKAVRAAHPDIPILMMSRPKHRLTKDEVARRAVVETTYKNALAAGDNNVYFLDGAALTELCCDEGTVDNTHPTDYGFVSMANAVCKVIEKIGL